MKTLYRAECYPWNNQVRIYEVKVLKETSKGYWVRPVGGTPWNGGKRWMDKRARKRYAWDTKIEALESLKRRVHRAIEITEDKLGQFKVRLFHVDDQLQAEKAKPGLLTQ